MGTIILAIFMMIVWWIPVIVDRQHGTLVLLSSRTFIAIGFTLMFALPSIYFTIYPWDIQGYEDFTPYYDDVLLMVILASLPFLLQSAFGCLRLKPVNTESSWDPLTNSKKIPPWFFMLLTLIFLGGIWAKLFQISTGSFFHLARTAYQFDQYNVFVLISIFLDYFIISGLFLLALGYQRRRPLYLWLGYAVVAIELGSALLAGHKLFFARLILQLGVLKIACGWLPKKRQIIAISIAGLFFLPIIGHYAALMSGQDPTKLPQINQVRERYVEAYAEQSFAQKMDRLVMRLGNLRGTAAVYSYMPVAIDYQYGKTYRHLLWFFIPRIIWHNKPDPREMADFTRRAMPYDAGSNPVSWVGEGYLNFSWYGVFMIGCVMAFLTRRLDGWFLPRVQSNIVWAVFWAFISYRFAWVSLNFSVIINEFLRLFIIMYFLNKFLSFGRPRLISRKRFPVPLLPKYIA